MQCAVCGHKNADGAKICASCGSALGLSAPGNPVSSTPGIATGGTSGDLSPAGVYSAHLTKGIRLQGGNYAVGEVLGQGGFGITYKGGDLALRRYVALKEFFPQGCARQDSTVVPAGTLSAADYAGVKSKFIEEARTLARFSDPGIVRVFGVFEENNTAYMVMEFLEGSTLSKRISEKGTLDENEVISIAEKVGHALSVVHETGLIHRDIKPDNICLTNDNRVVLIDFGTARAFASGKTVQQTTMLTPGYAPLEQYGQQARFGAYTDIYALAATLYHALTGQVPPQATDRAAGVELKPPHQLNPKVSQSVSQAMVWAMQIKASDRPQNITEFLDALKKGAQSAAPIVMPVPPGVVTPAVVSPVTGWGQAVDVQQPAPTGGAFATVQQVAENQVLTNASPQDALAAVHRAFQSFGIQNPTVDGASYRVLGSTGVDLRSWSQNVVGQISQDGRGTMVTVSSQASVGMVDYGRGRDETRQLVDAVQGALRGLPPASTVAPPQYQSPHYPVAPLPSPYGGSYPQRQIVRMQGGSVLTMGMLGIFCCGIFAPFAWFQGNRALQEYGDNDPGDRGSVVAGRIMGIIGTVLMLLGFSLAIIGSMSNN